MKKDIEWLKEAVGELNLVDTVFEADGVSYIDTAVSVMQVYDLIDQLDEPEKVEPLVVPKFVAEYLEFAKKRGSLIKVMETASEIGGLPTTKKVFGWISANDETFARAWLDGYEMEEEPLYYALIKGHELIDDGGMFWNFDMCDEKVIISPLNSPRDSFLTKMSKSEWSELGIND